MEINKYEKGAGKAVICPSLHIDSANDLVHCMYTQCLTLEDVAVMRTLTKLIDIGRMDCKSNLMWFIVGLQAKVVWMDSVRNALRYLDKLGFVNLPDEATLCRANNTCVYDEALGTWVFTDHPKHDASVRRLSLIQLAAAEYDNEYKTVHILAQMYPAPHPNFAANPSSCHL